MTFCTLDDICEGDTAEEGHSVSMAGHAGQVGKFDSI